MIRGNTYIFNMGGKTTLLESTEDVNAEVLDTIMDDGDIFKLGDQDFLREMNK
jgi:hypothetical protein